MPSIYDLVVEDGDFISSDMALLSSLLPPAVVVAVGDVSIVTFVVFVILPFPDFKGYSTDFVTVSRFDFCCDVFW